LSTASPAILKYSELIAENGNSKNQHENNKNNMRDI